jgi:cell division transport system permease protein
VTGRVRLLVGEAFRSLTANMSTTLAATLTVVIAMFLLGISISLGTLLLSYSSSVKKQLEVNVYFCSTLDGGACSHTYATRAEENAVARKIGGDSRVKKWQFVSRQQALALMTKAHPNEVGQLPSNPFPDKIVITPKRGEDTQAIATALAPAPPGVADVRYGKKETRTILGFAHAMEIGFIVAVGVLVIAATLLVGNTIRLSIFSRRREIEVMKLVGATNWFVRGPFMLEGIIAGTIGAAAAIVLLVLGKLLILGQLPGGLRSGGDVHALPLSLTALLLVGAGLLLGALGSGLTLRRFLQV